MGLTLLTFFVISARLFLFCSISSTSTSISAFRSSGLRSEVERSSPMSVDQGDLPISLESSRHFRKSKTKKAA